jgi:hypothetical protein
MLSTDDNRHLEPNLITSSKFEFYGKLLLLTTLDQPKASKVALLGKSHGSIESTLFTHSTGIFSVDIQHHMLCSVCAHILQLLLRRTKFFCSGGSLLSQQRALKKSILVELNHNRMNCK